MKSSTIQITKLEPSDGYWLTQKNLEEGEERIFSDSVYLGINDSEDNWTEWSNEDKERFENTEDASEL